MSTKAKRPVPYARTLARLRREGMREYSTERPRLALVLGLAIITMLITILATDGLPPPVGGLLALGAPIAVFFTFGGYLRTYGRTRRYNELTAEVLAFDEPGALPALLESREFEPYSVQRTVDGALLKLLPTVTEADAPLFRERHRRVLCKLLDATTAPSLVKQVEEARARVDPGDPLRLDALRVLGLVGSVAEVPDIEAFSRTSPNVTERAAALMAAGAIRERVGRAQDSAGLLRASDGTCAQGDLLLRASHESAQAGADLLRPDQPA